MNLQGKIALVTGASSGLGKSLATKLIAQGVTVLALARNMDKLQAAAAELGEKFICYQGDVSDKQSIQEACEKIKKEHTTIDILINNAGMWHQGPTEDHSLETLEQLLATNVFGTMVMINQIFPHMKKQKKGIIFTTNSLAGVEGHKDRSPYCATKRALTGYLKYFREEAAEHGVKVMQVHPGGMDTNLFNKFDDRTGEQVWKMDKNHVADVIMFMLSQPEDVSLETVVVRKFIK